MKLTPWDALGGQYELRPGAQHSVLGHRAVLDAGRLSHLLHGQAPDQVVSKLGSVFTLCAHAHRRVARLALDAAASTPQIESSAEQVSLCLETARDHLRSMALDWPQRLPQHSASSQNMGWLRDCPLPLVTAQPLTRSDAAWSALEQLRGWLEEKILVQSTIGWLARHREPEALALWCQAQSLQLTPAHCLSQWHAWAPVCSPEVRRLDVLDTDTSCQSSHLQQLAHDLIKQPDFAQCPTWRGQSAENGPWTRLRHRANPMANTVWTRLSARWLELVEIASMRPQTSPPSCMPLLSSGALKLSEGQALGWCEMARGLLLHWVQLDPQGKVQDYRVVAPTEWNFHPEGALAQALTALTATDTQAAQSLAAAFDPCVSCTVLLP